VAVGRLATGLDCRTGLYEAWLVDDLLDNQTIGEDEIEDVKDYLQARDHP
jgi:hypothetical protein